MSTCLLMADTERNLNFAAAVEAALGGLTQREVRRRTGISATYVGDMLYGSVPSFRKLEQLARGLGLAGKLAQDLFEAAGYAPPHDLVEGSNPNRLLDQVAARSRELTYDPDLSDLDIRSLSGKDQADISETAMETINDVVRALLSEERRKQGRE